MDICPAADQVADQVYQLSSVQLSPNRVQEDFDFDTMDVCPVFPVSLRFDGYFPSVSSVSSPIALSTLGSLAAPAPGSLLNEVTWSLTSPSGARLRHYRSPTMQRT